MRRRQLIAILLTLSVVSALLFAWQLPALLKAIPSRYVARLPEPIQTIGARHQGDLLPTPATNRDLSDLMVSDLTAPSAANDGVPATPTPPPTVASETDANETDVTLAATPSSSPAATETATPRPTTTAALPKSVSLTGFQHRIQTWNNCGPATLSMALSYYDLNHTQNQIAEAIKPDPEDRNVTPEEMAGYVAASTGLNAISRVNGNLTTLRRLLSEEIPVIVEYGLQPENEYRWLEWMGHYLLVTAYDDDLEQVWVYDSWPRTGEIPDESFVFEPLEINYEELERNWRAFNRAYVVLFQPEQSELVAEIIGEDMDETIMWENALTVVQEELRQEPDNAFLWFNLGTVFNARQDYERAAAAFDQARAIGLPWRMLWYQFGPYEAYYQTAQYEEVILLADITLRDRPYFEESYYYKAMAQFELGQVEEARNNLQRARAFNPNYTPARTALEELDLASN